MNQIPILSKDDQAVIKRCNDLIEEYGKKSTSLTGDQLLKINDKLSVSTCYLGEIAAEFNRNGAFAYSNRIKIKASNIVKRIAEGEGITNAKETSENSEEVKSARYDEITSSYLAETVENLLKGINNILRAIDRRLQFLAKEKYNAENNKGST